MAEFGDVFQDGFQSTTNGDDGRILASFHPGTNTFFIPELNAEQTLEGYKRLVKVYAISSKEEHLHSRENVGLMRSLMRLQQAAGQAVVDAIDDPNPGFYLDVAADCRETAEQIRNDLGPFKEAVDKTLLQLVMFKESDKTGYTRSYSDKIAEGIVSTMPERLQEGEEITGELADAIRSHIEYDSKLLSGRDSPTNTDNQYVGSHYFELLNDRVDQLIRERFIDSPAEQRMDVASLKRGIIEIITTVAIDISYPIQPLCGTEGYEPLSAPEVDYDSIEYPLDLEIDISTQQVQEFLGETTEDYEWNWIDKALVKAFLEFRELVEHENLSHEEITSDDTREIRTQLRHAVFDSERIGAKGMQDQPVLLYDMPAAIESNRSPSPDNAGDISAKIALQAFSQDGQLAAFVDNSTPENRSVTVNPAVVDEINSSVDPSVPADVDSFGELWRRSWARMHLVEELEDQLRQGIDPKAGIFAFAGAPHVDISNPDEDEEMERYLNNCSLQKLREHVEEYGCEPNPQDIDETCELCRQRPEPLVDCSNCRLLRRSKRDVGRMIGEWVEPD